MAELVCIHWPRRHHTTERTAALAAAITEHPGPLPVRVDTQHGVVDLGVSCAGDQPARLAIIEACERQVMVHVIDLERVGFEDEQT